MYTIGSPYMESPDIFVYTAVNINSWLVQADERHCQCNSSSYCMQARARSLHEAPECSRFKHGSMQLNMQLLQAASSCSIARSARARRRH